MKCHNCYMSVNSLLNNICSDCQQIDYKERGLNPAITLISEFGKIIKKQREDISQQQKIIDKQSQAIAKLAEYIDRINANSNSPYDNIEEEIKKILE